MSSFWLDKESLEIIGIGVFTVFVVYPILIKAVLGVLSLTDSEDGDD